MNSFLSIFSCCFLPHLPDIYENQYQECTKISNKALQLSLSQGVTAKQETEQLYADVAMCFMARQCPTIVRDAVACENRRRRGTEADGNGGTHLGNRYGCEKEADALFGCWAKYAYDSFLFLSLSLHPLIGHTKGRSKNNYTTHSRSINRVNMHEGHSMLLAKTII